MVMSYDYMRFFYLYIKNPYKNLNSLKGLGSKSCPYIVVVEAVISSSTSCWIVDNKKKLNK